MKFVEFVGKLSPSYALENQHLLPDCADLPSKLKFSPHTVAEIIAKCPQVSSSEFATSARGERSLPYTGALQGRILRSPIRRSG